MKSIIISIPFLLMLPFLKIYLSQIIATDIYGLLGTIWGISSLLGVQLIGAYPQLLPKEQKINNVIKIDYLSVFICVIIISVFFFKENISFVFFIICLFCTFISGMYEFLTIRGSILDTKKWIFKAEVYNLIPLVFIIIILFFTGGNNNANIVILFSYFLVIIVMLFTLGKISVVFITYRENKDYILAKVGSVFSQASIYLVPMFLYLIYDASFVGEFLIVFYMISLPLSFNQMVIRRLSYSNNKYNSRVLFFVFIFVFIFIETYIITYVINNGFLSEFIKQTILIDWICLFVYYMARFFYSYIYIRSRFIGISGFKTIIIEILRVILLILFFILFEAKVSNIIYSMSICFFISSLLYFLFISSRCENV